MPAVTTTYTLTVTNAAGNSTVGGVQPRTEAETQSVNPSARLVSVRVTKLSPTPVLVAGKPVTVGDVVWDDPLHWIPCI